MKPMNRTWQAVLLASLCAPVWPAAVPAGAKQRIAIHVVDLGIMQWSKALESGAGPAPTSLYPGLGQGSADPGKAQILLVMPDDNTFNGLSTQQLTGQLLGTLVQGVEEGRKAGVSGFEVRVVQHISRLGYATAERQAKVERFGEAAYAALAMLDGYLGTQGYEVSRDGILASNGTTVGAKNANYLAGWSHLDFVDGRADKADVIRVIGQIGAQNVRIFNTHGDWPAATGAESAALDAWFSLQFGDLAALAKELLLGHAAASIGNFDTSRELKEQFPELKVYLLGLVTDVEGGEGTTATALRYKVAPGSAHIAFADPANNGRLFLIQELLYDAATGRTHLSRKYLVYGRDRVFRGEEFEAKFLYLPMGAEEYAAWLDSMGSDAERLAAIEGELARLRDSLAILQVEAESGNALLAKLVARLKSETERAKTLLERAAEQLEVRIKRGKEADPKDVAPEQRRHRREDDNRTNRNWAGATPPPPPPPCLDGSPPPCKSGPAPPPPCPDGSLPPCKSGPPPPPPCPDGSLPPCKSGAPAMVPRVVPPLRTSSPPPPGCPPYCPGRGGAGIPVLPRMPAPPPGLPPAQRIGGVLLQGAAKVEGASGEVELTRGSFGLVVEGQHAELAPESLSRFLTALWAVYYSEQDPGISIDPIGPGISKHLVRYIGRVLNTDLGRVMRECDYLMKKWAVGAERPDVTGFLSVDDLSARHGLAYVGASRRFWFIPDEMTFRRGGDALLFASGRMTVRTEYTVNGLRGTAAPSDQRFADNFTRLYQQIAQRHPVYQEMFEYAKLVALAKYLKDSGVPLFWFLMANKDLVLTEDSPGTVEALVKGSRHFEGLTIEGGVDLRTQGRYVYDQPAVAAIETALARLPAAAFARDAASVAPGQSARASAEPFSFSLGKADYSVLPQHSLTSGKDRRGLRYQTDFALRGRGRPGLEVVRYFDPGRPEGGDFGHGWRLLIPYRVAREGAGTRPFLNVVVPEKMALENPLTGGREALTFSADRYAAAGWLPEKLAGSQVIGLFLMSDASFRLADKLGNEFWFDPAGNLTDLLFGEERRMHLEYAVSTSSAGETPRVASLSQGGHKVEFTYGLDGAGRPRIVAAELRKNEAGAPPAYLVRYHYDAEGRLAKVESESAPPVQARAARRPFAGGE